MPLLGSADSSVRALLGEVLELLFALRTAAGVKLAERGVVDRAGKISVKLQDVADAGDRVVVGLRGGDRIDDSIKGVTGRDLCANPLDLLVKCAAATLRSRV